MQTVLVTGAEGFTGSHLIECLRARGVQVVAGVRNRGRKLALERRLERVLVCDVSDPINVARAVASVKPDGIVHLAGNARAAQAFDEPLDAYQSIVTGWTSVLDAVRRAAPQARTVLVSACDVYGSAGADGRRLKEETPLSPVTPFGALKAAAESIAQAYHRSYRLNVSVVRPFHTIGPGQTDSFYFGAVARRIAEAGSEPGELRVTDAGCRRDVLHVRDMVEGCARVLVEGKPGVTYNVCSGQSVTCEQLVQAMIRASGKSLSLVPVDADDASTIACLCGDNGRLVELGWRPTRTADDAATELMRAALLKAGSKAPTPAGA